MIANADMFPVDLENAHISTAWAMPSRWTFQVPPIAHFISKRLYGCKIIVDPFCGQNIGVSHANDLANGGVDAQEYCESIRHDLCRADKTLAR